MSVLPLVSCDGADAARHLAALLAPAEPPLATGLLVAADSRNTLRALRKLLPAIRWQGIATGADVPARAADVVVALDGIALEPRSARGAYVQTVRRWARREAIVAAPLGTDLQTLIVTSLARYHRELLGTDHPALAGQLYHGLPTPQEALSWAPPAAFVELGFAGDVLAYRQMAERLIRSRRLGSPRGLLLHLLSYLLPETERLDLTLETVPMRRHRRLYLHLKDVS